MWLVEEEGDEGTEALQGDEDEVDCVRDFAGLVPVGVETKIDGAAEYLFMVS